MKLISNSFKDNNYINDKYSAYGQNIMPHLQWTDFPKETKSFALLMHDADAPIASGFWHLAIVNIPKEINEIIEGDINSAKGMVKDNDTDNDSYFGPMPPQGHGVHNYKFTIYALPFEDLGLFMESNGVKLTKSSSLPYAAFFIEMNKIDSASIVAKFEKK